jgi:hypothetical protein
LAYVYRHIRLDKNEPFYIGIGNDKSFSRAREIHNRNKYWTNVFSQTNIEIEILCDELTWEDARKKEIEFIKLYGRKDLGNGCLVNMTDGGEGALNPTKENRQKKSEFKTSFKVSEETKNKLSELKRGNKNPMFKKEVSEETRKKLSDAGKNKHTINTEHKARLLESRKNVPMTKQGKERLKQYTGIKSSKAKQLFNPLTGDIFQSIKEAAIFIGISGDSLIRYMKNHRSNDPFILNLKYITKEEYKAIMYDDLHNIQIHELYCTKASKTEVEILRQRVSDLEEQLKLRG